MNELSATPKRSASLLDVLRRLHADRQNHQVVFLRELSVVLAEILTTRFRVPGTSSNAGRATDITHAELCALPVILFEAFAVSAQVMKKMSHCSPSPGVPWR